MLCGEKTVRLLQIAAVITQRVRGKPPLNVQMVQELLDALRFGIVH